MNKLEKVTAGAHALLVMEFSGTKGADALIADAQANNWPMWHRARTQALAVIEAIETESAA